MDLDKLQEWDDLIMKKVVEYGLHVYPQEFEICDHFEMLGYMAYSGMPSRYPHWSFGKSYEREKTMYDYGVGGLPYEMVINSNPCLAYLMRDNTALLQVLTIAHVYGHNDFFASNFTFTSSIDAQYTLEMFKNHANRVRGYMEDPSIGYEAVERILDAAHSLSLQRSRNLATKQRSASEQVFSKLDALRPVDDEFQNINPMVVTEMPDLSGFPLEPTQNILEFIARYSPALADWERDLLQIVDIEARYFIPQIDTKIMNEGWASYWHYKILNELDLPHDMHLEFLVRHNQVLRPTPGGLNPYHLGFILWRDIERRWNEDGGLAADEPLSMHENDTPGRKKIFAVREADRDSSFLRRFLTREIMQDLDMFQHEKRGSDRVITKISDEDSWKGVRDTLVKNVGMGSIPIIHIIDADCGGKRELVLKHEHDGRDLLIEHAEKTLIHTQTLWGRPVVLETILNGKLSRLHLKDEKVKIERV